MVKINKQLQTQQAPAVYNLHRLLSMAGFKESSTRHVSWVFTFLHYSLSLSFVCFSFFVLFFFQIWGTVHLSFLYAFCEILLLLFVILLRL